MKLTIILPAYNVESIINETIQAICNQSFKDWELIAIDDGSQDNTYELLQRFSENDSRIQVIKQKNQGYRSVRNRGIENARGKYITFIDSDDIIDDNFLENLVSLMESKKSDLIISGYKKITEGGRIVGEVKYKNCESNNPLEDIGLRMIGSDPSASDSIMPVVWSNCYKTSIILENNIRFIDSKNIPSEDLVFNLEYLNCIKRAHVSSIVGYYYRLSSGSITRKLSREKIFIHAEMIGILKNTWKNKFSDREAFKNRLEMNFLIGLRGDLFRKSEEENVLQLLKHHSQVFRDKNINAIISEIEMQKYSFSRKIFIVIIKCRMTFLTVLASVLLNMKSHYRSK